MDLVGVSFFFLLDLVLWSQNVYLMVGSRHSRVETQMSNFSGAGKRGFGWDSTLMSEFRTLRKRLEEANLVRPVQTQLEGAIYEGESRSGQTPNFLVP